MTTQTSQPNGDGQLLRGAPALRAAARNALTARGPAEPLDSVEPVELIEPVDPEDSAEPPTDTEVPAEPPAVATTGWNEAGWYQNVRLLAEPPAEPDPPHEGEPPGPVATAERTEMFAKRPAEAEVPAEPDPEACYGGTVPEVAAIVEWVSAEKEREQESDLVPVELPAEAEASAYGAGAGAESGSAGATAPTPFAGPEARPERESELEPASVEAGASPYTADAESEVGPAPESGEAQESVPTEAVVEPEAADVPHSRGESWALPTKNDPPGVDTAGEDVDVAAPTAADGPSAPYADQDAVPADESVAAPAQVLATDDGPPALGGAAASPALSGIPAPVWDVSVRAGSGAAIPTRASVTFDSHRWSPLIVGEATHEIPVHLLFRDDESPVPAAGRPRARRAPVVSAPVLPPVLAPAATSRPATPVDTKLVERPGPTLPGWTAALVGVAGLFGCAVVLWWVGAVPEALTEMFGLVSNPYYGIGIGMWALLTVAVTLTLFAFGGLGRGRVGHAWVLTLFGEYRGSVRRTGLLWVSPLLLRRRVDVRLRHWRSEPMPAVDANGTALRVVVLVVWRVRDTVRAALGVRDHEEYLREQVEAAMARVLSQLPADAFNEAAPTLRNAEVVGEALTRMLSAECRPVGLDVFSAQPTRIEYAPEISAAMQRSRIAAIDARHRDTVLTSVVDAVDDTVHRLTSRGLVELDDYERKVLVKDLTVAFYTGRHGLNEGN
ncbi:SPFH domain-containing protein [Streptomyces sp. NPDC057137]|uniref:SPFH domain-containing protein n=1 Tax=Streptomyces sp. NPDC057137 TaxID=3346030 RepID=UPI003635FC44